MRDLLASDGTAVHVVADAVASRAKANWRAGLDLMDRLGAIITTTEISGVQPNQTSLAFDLTTLAARS